MSFASATNIVKITMGYASKGLCRSGPLFLLRRRHQRVVIRSMGLRPLGREIELNAPTLERLANARGVFEIEGCGAVRVHVRTTELAFKDAGVHLGFEDSSRYRITPIALLCRRLTPQTAANLRNADNASGWERPANTIR